MIRWLGILLCIALLGAAVWLGLTAPAPGKMGTNEVGRILFFHMPVAINSLVGFLVAGVASLVYLLRKTDAADRWARSAALTGVVMATLTLVSGMAWAKLAWGHYWDFKSYRLTFSLILWLLFVGYLLLRSSLPAGPHKKRVAAVYCLIACLDIPLVYLSTRLFVEDIHPPAPEAFAAAATRVALVLAIVAVTATHAMTLALAIRRAARIDRRRQELAGR